MEARELRISNLVYHNGEIIEIKSLHPENDDVNDEIPFHSIYGIKITEQWLLDFGAVKIDKDFYNLGEFKILHHINEDFKWTLIYKGITLINNIKHVHRLQNLYFALNNNELIRKL